MAIPERHDTMRSLPQSGEGSRLGEATTAPTRGAEPAGGRTTYDRMSAADQAFLAVEDGRRHMHIGGVAIFDLGPLATAEGGVDIERIRRHIGSRLHLVPRYRQRLAWVPFQSRPVWVDDEGFDVAYHVRHLAVPRPGDERQLKRLCGLLMSQELDRAKPLWEIWVIEGIEGGRFAMLIKTHHCIADGIATFDVFAALVSRPSDEPLAEATPWVARPTPGPLTLLRDELVRRGTVPLDVVGTVLGALGEPGRLRSWLAETGVALRDMAGAGFRVPADTPVNRPVGPHRRFDWCAFDLTAVKRVKNGLGGTVNDVVLATVAGAVRRFLIGRGTDVGGLDFRAVVPVNVRTPNERGMVTNRASAWLMSLPIGEADPCRRLLAVRTATARLRSAKQEVGPVVLGQVAEWVPPAFLAVALRLAARLPPYNVMITNVAGPQFPLDMLGARLLIGYPQVPLFENQAIGIGLFSYMGQLAWGFTADRDAMPDLHEFVEHVRGAFGELAQAEGVAHAAAPPR